MYCGECGKWCYKIVRDFGIGGYEFWGAKGYDSHRSLVSECCEASIYLDPEQTEFYSLDDLRRDEACERAEQYLDY